jgi:tRNA (Thr-GGU) A37 N-methylase
MLRVHPRGDRSKPLAGVFATRSPNRPNPIGLHRTRILKIEVPSRILVESLELVDQTPVIDIKPVLLRERYNNGGR